MDVSDAMGRPLVLGYHRTDPYVPQLMDTAVVAVFAAWCRREGYDLGVPYRDNTGDGGAFEAMLGVLRDREDVAGVIVPSLDHLGVDVLERRERVASTGKALYVAYPAPCTVCAT